MTLPEENNEISARAEIVVARRFNHSGKVLGLKKVEIEDRKFKAPLASTT
jgi:hypothetical protein